MASTIWERSQPGRLVRFLPTENVFPRTPGKNWQQIFIWKYTMVGIYVYIYIYTYIVFQLRNVVAFPPAELFSGFVRGQNCCI